MKIRTEIKACKSVTEVEKLFETKLLDYTKWIITNFNRKDIPEDMIEHRAKEVLEFYAKNINPNE